MHHDAALWCGDGERWRVGAAVGTSVWGVWGAAVWPWLAVRCFIRGHGAFSLWRVVLPHQVEEPLFF